MGVTGTRLDLRSTQEVYNFPCMTCITKIFQPTESPLTIPHYAIPDITVPTETGDKLMPTQGRGFPGFLPACMQGTWGWLSSQVCSFPTAWKSLICIHAYDHITWNNKFSEMRWCYKRVNEHTKNIMPGIRMLAFNVWKGRVHSKTFGSLSPLSKILFKKYFWINTQIQKQHKSCLKYFSNKS